MAEGTHLDSDYLDRRASRLRERTFLGGYRISTRIGFMIFLGLAAAAAMATVLWYADKQASLMMNGWLSNSRIVTVLVRIEEGLSQARQRQNDFQRHRDMSIVDSHQAASVDLAEDLAVLDSVVGDIDVRREIATVQEAFQQYVSLFDETIAAEQQLGLTNDDGLRGQFSQATEGLRSAVQAAEITEMDDRITQLGQKVRLVDVPLSDQDRGLLELEYDAIGNAIDEAVSADTTKSAIRSLIDAHRTAALAFINARTVLAADPQRFSQIFDYIDPSLSAIRAYAQAATEQSPQAFIVQRERLRFEVGGAALAILVVYVLIAIIVLRSVANPLRRVSMSAARLAQGDKVVAVPAQRNNDAVGDLARALDGWMDDLVEADHLRLELEDAKARLETALSSETDAIQRADAAEKTAHDVAEQMAAMAIVVTEAPVSQIEAPAITELPIISAAPDVTTTPYPAETVAPEEVYDESELYVELPEELEAGVHVPSLAYQVDAARARSGEAGPIFTVSQQLSQFTDYISAAARDVERTEVLIRTLGDASILVDELTDTIAGFRDQTHALVFAASDASTEQAEALAPRFQAIRDVTDRAERIVDAVRGAVDEVVGVSHDIAETASTQALDATRKLLAQSEHLQAMLDDVMSKLNPSSNVPPDDSAL